MKSSTIAALAATAAVLAAPAAASAQATLTADPVSSCYREQEHVKLVGTGFTPNSLVNVTRDAATLGQLTADPAGQVLGDLTLPGLASGDQRLTYVATDTINPALVAQAELLVSATDVGIKPRHGKPSRVLRIRGRGFFGGKRLYAHVVRSGRPARTARHVRIGPVKGACKTVKAKKRIFPSSAAPGRYRVQFDTFRKYKPKRQVESEFIVTVRLRAAAAAAASDWVRIR